MGESDTDVCSYAPRDTAPTMRSVASLCRERELEWHRGLRTKLPDRRPTLLKPPEVHTLARATFPYGDRHGRLCRKLSIAQQYSMTRNGIHSALCFARSIHIPRPRARVSMIQKIPS